MSLGAVAVLLLVTAAGYGLLSAFRFQADNGPEYFGFAFAAGATLLAVVAGLLSAFGPLAVPWALGGVLGVAAALPFLLRRPGLVSATLRWAGYLPVLPVVLICFWLATARPVWNVDAQLRWVQHGQWLAEHATLLPEGMRDASWAATHPSYPPLVSAMAGFAMQLGADRDEGVRLLFPMFFAALLGILHGFARRTAGPKAATWIPLGFALTPCFFWLDHHGLTFGLGADAALADLPLALLLCAASVLVLDAFRWPRSTSPVLMGWLAAGGTLTKQEGSAFLLLMLGLTFLWLRLVEPGSRKRAAAILSWGLGGTVLTLGGWAWATAAMPVAPGESYLSLRGIGAVFGGLSRLPAILAGIQQEMMAFSVWGLLWWWIPVWVFLAVRARRLICLLPGCWLLAGLAVATAGFLASGWRDGDYETLMDVSLTRLLMHHAPLMALMICHVGLFCRPNGTLTEEAPADSL